MEKFILQSENPEDRITHLRDIADSFELMSYPRDLSQEEVIELQASLSQDMIFIDNEDQVLAVAKEVWKSNVKPVKQSIAKKLQMVRTQVEDCRDEVFLLKDVQENKMGYYSKEGKLILERPLKADEMQYSIQEHLRKTS